MVDTTTHVRVAIAGTGFAGLGTAIRLRQEHEDDFVVFERAADLGGTWRDNSYPGCACDVPSHLYSFSFALNPDWSRSFSPQPEILAYLRRCAEDAGVLPHVRFGHEVLSACWRDEAKHWRIETTGGVYTADVFVAGVGALHEPSIPKLAGLETFDGTMFHSAQWDHDHDLTGRSVAVIGTGASAIQFVPKIAERVGFLTLFQRTAPWVMPRRDRKLRRIENLAYRHVPGLQRLARSSIYWARELAVFGLRNPDRMRIAERIAKAHLRRQVADPALRAKLTPDYRIGCKRILISNDYLPALGRSNVEVVTDGIREIRPQSVVTEDGVEHAVDTIIFGTGFHVTDLPIGHRVRGRSGQTLAETWQGSPKAHLGTTVTGFPNLFLLLGPNTGLGHSSVVFMIEAQIAHVIDTLRQMRRRGLKTVEPRPAAQEAFVSEVDREMKGTVWTDGGCQSWYLDATGRNSTLWPGFTMTFRRRVQDFRPDEYLVSTS